MPDNIQSIKRHEIPGCVTIVEGNGGLARVNVATGSSTAEIYLHGAHVTGFQKNGGPPLLFLSGASQFAAGKAIRGGVPVCFPWFGAREGSVMHGFARITEWQLVKTTAAPDGTVRLQFALPGISGQSIWNSLRTEFVVSISDTLTMELTTANESCDRTLEIENCLHTYFAVGDINQVSIVGLKGMEYLDKTDNFARKLESGDAIKISSEVDRVFPNATGPVEIHDEKLRRKIAVEKSGSASAVVWNPWIAKARAMADFGDEEYRQMVCVESGNVGENKIALAPGTSSALKVILSSGPLK